MTRQEVLKAILDKATSIAAVEGVSIYDRVAVSGAINHVLGEGSYDFLVADLYNALRAKAAA